MRSNNYRFFIVLLISIFLQTAISQLFYLIGINNILFERVAFDFAWALTLTYAFWVEGPLKYAHRQAVFHQTLIALFFAFLFLTAVEISLGMFLFWMPVLTLALINYALSTLVYALAFAYLSYPSNARRIAHLNPYFRRQVLMNILYLGLFNLFFLLR